MIPKIKEIKISSPSTLSDHCPLTSTIVSNSIANGPDFWQFDNSLLNDLIFVNKCNYTIRSTIFEYIDSDIDLQDGNTQYIIQMPSKCQPSLLLDMILIEVCQKQSFTVQIRRGIKINTEPTLKGMLSSSIWKMDKLKVDLLPIPS